MDRDDADGVPDTRKPRRRFERVAIIYRQTAIIVLNTLLLLVVTNGCLWLTGQPTEDTAEELGRRVLERYGESLVTQAYPDRSREEVRAIHMETWSHPLVPAAYTGFTEQPRTGRYANVSPDGYRAVREQGPWPPSPSNLNVFVFGGSTVFGYGLADEETIPSRLQDALRAKSERESICVYNLGCGYYFSSQERVLLGSLAAEGIKPDVAIFIDGLNEALIFDGNPVQPGHLVPGAASSGWFEQLPLLRLARKMTGPSASERTAPASRAGPDSDDPISGILDRYLRNVAMMRAICDANDIQPLFVWQPISTFRIPPSANPFPSPEGYTIEKDVYERFDLILDFEKPPANFFWAADLQIGRTEILYVDDVHYSAVFCEVIAQAIARQSVFESIPLSTATASEH